MTLPPLKATSKALIIPLSFAAVVVLEFAFVALFIPIYPAAKLKNAPKTKEKAVPSAKNKLEYFVCSIMIFVLLPSVKPDILSYPK